jgi:glutamate synthase (NADPH/NADH) small chain
MSRQGARCMDCGIPFCQTGCPVNNIIPDWNDLVYRGGWREALDVLHSTNNFPEFTGRVCPAPCEAACVLNINNDPVAIKSIEQAIVDKGWAEGWIGPQVAPRRTGKKVAVVGSGPAGMACASSSRAPGHDVTLFEKSDRIGGLMRYGIPDFKMEKHHIDRRMEQMASEGVTFRTGVHVGVDAARGRAPRAVRRGRPHRRVGKAARPAGPGTRSRRHPFAMEFLPQQNKKVAGDNVAGQILATGKHVVVIGGGDTGSDCIGTSIRQGAASVDQLRADAAAARAGGQAAHVARTGRSSCAPRLARGRRRARLRRRDQALHRQGRKGGKPHRVPRRMGEGRQGRRWR